MDGAPPADHAGIAGAPPTSHSGTGAAGPADRAVPDRSDAGTPPAGPPAWAVLPPIQRVVPDEPRLLRPESFTASLAAWGNPSYLAPLGHVVGDAEPAGTLHGAAVPVADPPSTGETLPLPLASPPSNRPAPVRVQRLVGPAGPLLTAPAPALTRHLPTVAPATPAPLPAAPVTAEAPPMPLASDAPATPVTGNGPEAGADTWSGPGADAPEAAPGDTDAPTLGQADGTESLPVSRVVESSGPSPAPSPLVVPLLAQGGSGPTTAALPAPLPQVRDTAVHPVQRAADVGGAVPRRLGLGRPIVSLVPPLTGTGAAAGWVGGGNTPGGGTTPGGDITVARHATEGPSGGPGPPPGPPTPPGRTGDGHAAAPDLPLSTAGPADAATPDAGRAGAPESGPEPVQRFPADAAPSTPVLDQAPLLGQAAAPIAGAAAGPDVSFGAVPVQRAVTGPDLPLPTTAGAMVPEPVDAPPSPPPAVARLIGDRPPVLFSGVEPVASTPAPPAVQRVRWERDDPEHTGRPSAGPAGPGSPPPSSSGPHVEPADPGSALAPIGAEQPGVLPSVGTATPPVGTAGMPVQRSTGADGTAWSVSATGPGGNLWQGSRPGGSPGPATTNPGQTPLPATPSVGTYPVPVQRWVGAPLGPAPDATTGAGYPTGWPSQAPPVVSVPVVSVPVVSSPADRPVVQRAAGWDEPAPTWDEPAPAPDSPPVTEPPAATPPGEPLAEPVGEAPPPTAAAGGPAAGPAAGMAAGVEPEELLKKLYDPLLRRLRTELRLDRERHGVLSGPG
ncbi:hypothetical protein V6U90_27890 [Micromonospora sp. CPCC 206060]|uniref:hypothetical protein n=1 Tax=Micromonospora sp. CPCC 206060 TaxID=3122406 RepID=UPI002FEE6BD7